jgi:hypothetical protein
VDQSRPFLEWLSFKNGLALASSFCADLQSQLVSLFADLSILSKHIPIAPESTLTDLGPMYEWIGRVGDRFFTIECRQGDVRTESGVL